MSTEPVTIKFSIEETKANLKSKHNQTLVSLLDLARSTVRSSESHELFKNCFKSFTSIEQPIEAAGEKLKKIDIISTQLNYQVDAIRADCEQLKEICHQINSATSQKKSH